MADMIRPWSEWVGKGFQGEGSGRVLLKKKGREGGEEEKEEEEEEGKRGGGKEGTCRWRPSKSLVGKRERGKPSPDTCGPPCCCERRGNRGGEGGRGAGQHGGPADGGKTL
jgi:hypothetical protein